jgi:hypothetical protein
VHAHGADDRRTPHVTAMLARVGVMRFGRKHTPIDVASSTCRTMHEHGHRALALWHRYFRSTATMFSNRHARPFLFTQGALEHRHGEQIGHRTTRSLECLRRITGLGGFDPGFGSMVKAASIS